MFNTFNSFITHNTHGTYLFIFIVITVRFYTFLCILVFYFTSCLFSFITFYIHNFRMISLTLPFICYLSFSSIFFYSCSHFSFLFFCCMSRCVQFHSVYSFYTYFHLLTIPYHISSHFSSHCPLTLPGI
jgi:hypothetical protein